MSDPQEKKKAEPVYEIKGIPIKAFLLETGEFRWTPTSKACGDKENAEGMMEVLRKLPPDRRTVWATRLDTEQTKKTCPVIRNEANLCKELDEFCATYNNPRKRGRTEVNARNG